MSAFSLNLITTHWYSGAASVRVTLGKRRDCIDRGGSMATATFT
jgi:hypothetical protein